MTTDNKIGDKIRHYDMKREAAKISALSSGKIDKYEYLTGEEILPSDQSRIIKQAKLIYCPSWKAFENQIETTEFQGEKQIKTLKEHGKQLVKYNNEKESLTHSKQKEIVEELANRGMKEIKNLSKQIDLNSLIYQCKVNNAQKRF